MEKVYLCLESESIVYRDEETGELDFIEGNNPHEFKSEDELLRLQIKRRISDDGQIFRFINDFIDELVVDISDEIFNGEQEYNEFDKEDWFTDVDVCQMIINRAKELKKHYNQRAIREKKESELDDLI